MKKAFYLYQDQQEVIEQLTDIQAGKLFKAIYKYANNEKPELSPVLRIVFTPIRQALDRNRENYEKVSQINKANAKKRWDQPQNNATASERMQTHLENANRNDKDKDKDKDISSLLKENEEVTEVWPEGLA